MTIIVKKTWCYTTAILEDVKNRLVLDNASYVVWSSPRAWANDSAPPAATSTVAQTNDFRKNMMFGARISSNDMAPYVRRIDWTTDEVYDMYRHDVDMSVKDFYVLTDDRNVYKCLYNAKRSPSTSKPALTYQYPFKTADGYIWKYLYTLTQNQLDTLGDLEGIPVIANSTVTAAAAIDGSIEVITVDTSGSGWTATSNGAVLSVVSNTVFQINSLSSTVNGTYTGSAFYVTSGPAAGLLSTVTNHVSNSTGNWVQISTANGSVSFGDLYYISPAVNVDGDGSGAKAIAVVNTISASIDRIDVVAAGLGYTWANAIVTSSASNASFVSTAIISPPGGHGADPIEELCCDSYVIYKQTTNADSGFFEADYRSVGILASPKSSANVAAAYVDTSFVQYTQANTVPISPYTGAVPIGEMVVGQTSGASAYIAQSNATHIRMTSINGVFEENESAITQSTFFTFTISSINKGQIERDSGELIAYSTFSPITKTNISTDKVRLVIKV